MTDARRTARDRDPGPWRGQAGMSLIEVVVALGLFGVTSAVLVGLGINGYRVSQLSTERLAASQLAQSDLDAVRAEARTTAPLIGTTARSALAGRIPFTITRTTQWVTAPGVTTRACGTPGSPATNFAYLNVATKVTWARSPDRGVQIAGIVYPGPNVPAPIAAPPAAAPTRGAYVTVEDVDGNPVPTATVTFAGPIGGTASTTTWSTDATGCAFVTGLAVGSYSVTAAKAGSTQVDGSPNATTQLVIAPQPTSFPTWLAILTPAAPLNMHIVPRSGRPIPAAGLPIRFWGSHRTSSHTKPITATTPLGAAAVTAFRDAGAVTPVAGTCADSNQPVQPTTSVPLAGPGVGGGVATGAVTVRAKTASGSPASNAVLVAVHEPDGGCPAGEFYRLAPTNGGGITTASLPFGSWSFRFALGDTSIPGAAEITPVLPAATASDVTQ